MQSKRASNVPSSKEEEKEGFETGTGVEATRQLWTKYHAYVCVCVCVGYVIISKHSVKNEMLSIRHVVFEQPKERLGLRV
jgi:hypothetical protein